MFFFFFYPVSRCEGGHSSVWMQNVLLSSAHELVFFHSALLFCFSRMEKPKVGERRPYWMWMSCNESFQGLLGPRSLCERLGLSNWVCVGPFQLGGPFRKQTVSLGSLLLNPPSSCLL